MSLFLKEYKRGAMAEAAYVLNGKPAETWECVPSHFDCLSILRLPLSGLVMVNLVCVTQCWTPGALGQSSNAHLHLQPSLP